MLHDKLIGAISAVLMVTAAGAASASVTNYDWSFTATGGAVLADGTLQADDSTGDVLSFAGTVFGAGAVTSFTPGSGNDGVFQWDNVIDTAGPHVDYSGILFQTSSLEWNIYNNGGFPGGDVLANSSDNYGGTGGTFDLVAPEPSTWAMMGLGFAFAGYRARRTATAIA